MELDHELAMWREAGEHIASRDQAALRSLEHGGDVKASLLAMDSSVSTKIDGAVNVASVAEHVAASSKGVASTDVKLGTSVTTRAWSTSFAHPVVVGTFLVVGFLLLSFAQLWWPAKADDGQSSRRGWISTSIMRCLGIVEYKIEVSEVHVGSVLSCGNVYITLQHGKRTMRTRVLRRSDGSFLKFNEVFIMNMLCPGEPLTMTVIEEQGGELAKLTIPATEVVRVATSEHLSYLRSELTPNVDGLRQLGKNLEGRKPYAAMKLRNVTDVK